MGIHWGVTWPTYITRKKPTAGEQKADASCLNEKLQPLTQSTDLLTSSTQSPSFEGEAEPSKTSTSIYILHIHPTVPWKDLKYHCGESVTEKTETRAFQCLLDTGWTRALMPGSYKHHHSFQMGFRETRWPRITQGGPSESQAHLCLCPWFPSEPWEQKELSNWQNPHSGFMACVVRIIIRTSGSPWNCTS